MDPQIRSTVARFVAVCETCPDTDPAVATARAALRLSDWPAVPQRSKAWLHLRRTTPGTASNMYGALLLPLLPARKQGGIRVTFNVPAYRKGGPCQQVFAVTAGAC